MNLFEYLLIIVLTFTNVLSNCLRIFFESGMINDIGLYLMGLVIIFFTCTTLTCIRYKHEILNKITNGDNKNEL